jgi:ATP-dependent DNA helicase RecQ
LLWNYADVKTREFLIDRDREEQPGRSTVPVDPGDVARRKEIEHKKLRRMVGYADAAGCLRATILRYFGDPAAFEPCGACGNCDRLVPLDESARDLVRKILSGILRAGERFGRRKIAAMLIGDVEALPDSLKSLSTTGLLQHEGAPRVEQWIDAAGGAGLIRVSDDQYRTLSLTPLGREVMAGRVGEVRMAAPVVRLVKTGRRPKRLRLVAESHVATRRPPASSSAPEPRHAEHAPVNGARPVAGVIDVLRAWRLDQARQRAVAPFVILHDRTLVAIATVLPRSLDELEDVPGIGPAKLAAYGDAILAAVARSVADKT